MNEKMTYKDAGVDVDLGDRFVSAIKGMVKKTYNPQVVSGVGGYASLYDIGDRYICGTTDGVGTKILLAQKLGVHDSIGIDLVAMCVNDLICVGARPLFFLDYYASGKLEMALSEAILHGVTKGCLEAGTPLMGGETAEMPGLYAGKDYDLAGFAVGEVAKDAVIDGSKVNVGDSIIGILSSGFHSNGYSLLRKLFPDDEKDAAWQRELLTPTKIYVKPLLRLLQSDALPKGSIRGLAHITGGGFHNIRRINDQFDYVIDNYPSRDFFAPVFSEVEKRSGLDANELFSTFNMGIGLVMVVDPAYAEKIIEGLKDSGERAVVLGQVQSGRGDIILHRDGGEFVFSER